MKQKSRFLCVLIVCIGLFSGCSNKSASKEAADQNNQLESDRVVNLPEIGLRYHTPEIWKTYEKQYIYPSTSAPAGSLAQVQYSFFPQAAVDKSKEDAASPLSSDDLPVICNIIVLKSPEDVPNENGKIAFPPSLEPLLSQYITIEEIGSQNGYSYYFLWGYLGSVSNLTEEEKKAYEEIVNACPELRKTIELLEFDPEAFIKQTDEYNSYVSFQTTTLEGAAISSAVFAAHDITMLHFEQTSSYDESAVLQEVYEALQGDETMGLLTAITDTPSPENEKKAAARKSAVNGEYTSIVMDTGLVKFLTSHFEEVPVTVFVNTDGKMVGEALTGPHTAQEYLEALGKAKELLQ